MKRLFSLVSDNAGPAAAGGVFAASLLGLCTILRLALVVFRWDALPHGAGTLLAIFWAGFRLDVLMCGILSFPAAAVAALLPRSFLDARSGRLLVAASYFFFLCLFVFLSVVEVAFFDEFDARFNYIAVDYLLFPTEVAGNIWQSYPLMRILAGVLAASAFLFIIGRPLLRRAVGLRAPLGRRLAFLGATLLFLGGLWAATGLETSEISENRVANEIAGNGHYGFFYSLWSNDLDYGQYYPTMDRGRALDRVKGLLKEEEGVSVDNPENPLERRLTEDGDLHHPNVVIILDESFGATYTGVLGRHPENLTPRFDRLAEKGVLFTNFYATGSRTVRGLEAVLCGFPPVPGTSVLKRPKTDGFFTLADVMKTNGYETLFVYGGRGIFDNMSRFMLRNGFDRFIEQKDYPSPTFTTAWGVCDEDIFHRALEEFDALDRAGKRFFGVVLTVSNHKPYTYPAGRIDLDPNRRRRENAFKYADWALGDFFEKAEEKPFFKNTVFAFLGDHGARVYGADFIPIRSYEVPLLLYAPGRLKPARIDTLACSMDVAPTVLGLTDLSYRSVFFGRDILDLKPAQGYALMQHDRDVGFLQGDRLAVLGVPKTGHLYHFDRTARSFTPIPRPDLAGVQQLHTAAAFYQTAYGFYKNGAYRLGPAGSVPPVKPGDAPLRLSRPAEQGAP